MENKRFITLYLIFYTGYIIAELLQKEMFIPQFIRHHMSDFFCGPVITTTATLIIGFYINKINFVPAINCLLCIIWEINVNFDPIDLCCYILGTITFYTILNLKL